MSPINESKLTSRTHSTKWFAILSQPERGFSLIEMMVVLLVITIIMGTVFKFIGATQQTSATEQVKLNLIQEAREFMDQITRDLRSAGYPSSRNMSQGATDANGNVLTSPQAPENGVGLIYVNDNPAALWFAGDVDGTSWGNGTAQVKLVRYDYVAAGPGEPGCPCLRRTEFLRNGGDPVADANNPGTAAAQLEIQGVQNGTPQDPIFTAFDPNTGLAVTLPVDFTNNGNTVAAVNSLRIALEVQSQYKDSTGAYPVVRVVSSVALNNCSEAIGGMALSC